MSLETQKLINTIEKKNKIQQKNYQGYNHSF